MIATELGIAPAEVERTFSARDVVDLQAFWSARSKVEQERMKQQREQAKANKGRRR